MPTSQPEHKQDARICCVLIPIWHLSPPSSMLFLVCPNDGALYPPPPPFPDGFASSLYLAPFFSH